MRHQRALEPGGSQALGEKRRVAERFRIYPEHAVTVGIAEEESPNQRDHPFQIEHVDDTQRAEASGRSATTWWRQRAVKPKDEIRFTRPYVDAMSSKSRRI